MRQAPLRCACSPVRQLADGLLHSTKLRPAQSQRAKPHAQPAATPRRFRQQRHTPIADGKAEDQPDRFFVLSDLCFVRLDLSLLLFSQKHGIYSLVNDHASFCRSTAQNNPYAPKELP
jgi:hypothetical protein